MTNSMKREGYHRAKSMLPEIRRLIITAARFMEIKRDDLADLLLIKIKRDYPHETPPKIETIVKEISKARNSKPNDFDKPWSTAVCSEYVSYFPPDTIPLLMQLWRYSIHLDEVFTIRHAIWASRLAFQLKDMDIARQWLHTVQYAKEEELSLLSNTPMNTFELDSSLVMGVLEKFTSNVGLEAQSLRFSRHNFVPTANDCGIMEEFIHAFPMYGFDDEDLDLSQYNDRRQLYLLISELPSSSKFFPDMESRMIYLDNLSSICKLPKWTTLSSKEIKDIIIELRIWVLDAKIKREKPNKLEGRGSILGNIGLDPLLYPKNIYERLGWSFKGVEE